MSNFKIQDFLSQINPFSSNNDSKTVNVSPKEMRYYERFNFELEGSAFITDENNISYPILNISYGGFAIKPDIMPNFENTNNAEDVIFSYLDLQIKATIRKVYQSSNLIGYRFEHKDPKTLIFLREILENIRYGSSLHVLKKEFLKDKFQNENWVCLRGEGPTDLIVQFDENRKIIEFLCSYRDGEHYYEFRLRNNSYSTGRSIDKEGVGSRMTSTPELDRKTVRSVITILLGVNDEKLSREFGQIFYFGKKFLLENKSEEEN